MTGRRFSSGSLQQGSPEAVLFDGLEEVLMRLEARLDAQDQVLKKIEQQVTHTGTQVNWLVMKEQQR
jgi:hypothetical protein